MSDAPEGKRIVYKKGPVSVGFTVPRASMWLPAVAVFLCLAIFGMAALVLVDAGAEPKTPESATVTSISAQGFQGLRRLLDTRGMVTGLNRYKDGPDAMRGDLEIITLDAPGGGLFQFPLQRDASSADSANDDDEDGTTASADAAVDQAQSSSSAASPDPAALDAYFVPSPEEAGHLLYHPLGRAVLVVAPKWSAGVFARQVRWAVDPELVDDETLRDMLAELSPETETPQVKSKDGKPVAPAHAANQGVFFPDDKTAVVYDKVPYTITHGQPASNLIVHQAGGGGEMAVGHIESLQSITAPNLVPVIVGPNGEALLSRVVVTGGRKATTVPVYLLSDPDLLNNQILSDPRKVTAAMALVDGLIPPHKAAPTVVFNLTFNGLAFERDLVHALSRPPYVGIPLSLLILGLGLMWAAFARFGPALHVANEAPLGRGVRILADNAARLMALTIRETKLAPAYASLMRDLVLKGRGYMQVSPSQTLDDLADRIGKMHNTTHSFAALKAQAAQVTTVHQLIDLALKLHAWKTEIQRAHI